jgi:predicted kinase
MLNIYILCGLPGSGKSTWARKKVEEDSENKTIIINKDSIREMLFGIYKYLPEAENLVSMITHISIWEAIDRNYNIIVDECHMSAQKRKHLFVNFNNRDDLKITLVYFTENENNLSYRMLDPRGLSEEKWADVIDGMKENFEVPTQDELGSKVELITVDSIHK